MAKLTKDKLKKILTGQLKLQDPQYFLETAGDRVVGSIVSDSFKGKADHERQAMIWDALADELGAAESVILVGMLLAYTPEEWNLGADGKPKTTKRRMVG